MSKSKPPSTLWNSSYDWKGGFRRHAVAPGFGHSLLAPVVAQLFTMLRVSASLCDGESWWSVHYVSTPFHLFELEHGDGERAVYNSKMIERVRRAKKALRGGLFGFSDLFVPILARGEFVGVLVVGPFQQARPSSVEIQDRWRTLTGRQGDPADPEFAAFLAATLASLVLEGDSVSSLEKFVGCLARLMAGEGDAGALTNEANALATRLEPARLTERTWEAVAEMLDERTPHAWSSSSSAWSLDALGVSRVPEHVLVGLSLTKLSRLDPVDEAVRRHDWQRAAVDLARQSGDALAGRVGSHGVVFLVSASGGVARKRQKLFDLSDHFASLASRRFGLSLHFGASLAAKPLILSRRYQLALGAAETALAQGTRLVFADAEANRPTKPLRDLREELAHAVRGRPELLSARFDGYLEAVTSHCGYRLDAVRGHLEAGFERVAEPLLANGELDKRSFRQLCDGLDRAAQSARGASDLEGAYRRAVADLVRALQEPVLARQDRSLRAAVDYIRQHYAEPLSFKEVARVAGFNPTYFSELFKKRERMTFEKYVRTVRLERARQLLSSTELEVSRVAALSGFSSAQYFSHGFRQAFGLTPLEFRRQTAVDPPARRRAQAAEQDAINTRTKRKARRIRVR